MNKYSALEIKYTFTIHQVTVLWIRAFLGVRGTFKILKGVHAKNLYHLIVRNETSAETSTKTVSSYFD